MTGAGRIILVAVVLGAIAGGCDPGRRVVGRKGFYRLAREDGTWWFLEPGGRRTVSIGLNHIEPVLISSESNRELFARRYGVDLADRDSYGEGARRWASDSMKLARSWGFNTLGVHNPVEQHEMPYVASFRPAAIDGWDKLERSYPDPFDPATAAGVETAAGKWCEKNAADPMIVGVSFNDMPLWRSYPGKGHPWVSRLMDLPAEAPGKKRWVEVLEGRYRSAAEAAEVYAIDAATWGDFLATTSWPAPARPWKALGDVESFLPIIADTWYGVVTGSIRRCDPNHLVFGDKLDASIDMPPWLDPIVGRHFDLAFIQWYEYADRQIPRLRELHEATGEPVLMGDSTFSAASEGIPSPKGVILASQDEVGPVYAEYLETILAEPYVVGWHHCGFIEGSPDLAKIHPYFAIQPGLLRPDGTAHEETVAKVTEANGRALEWHEGPTDAARRASGPTFRMKKGYPRCQTTSRPFHSFTVVDSNVFNVGSIAGPSKVPLKNIGWVVTRDGVVVIDTGLAWMGRYAKAVIRSMTGRPVKYIIYTHHHGTQTDGAAEMRDAGTRIIAHEDFVVEMGIERDLEGFSKRRNRIQFDLPVELDRVPPLMPDITYADEYAFTLGGVRFELKHVEGEARDYTVVFLPEQRIVWVADLLGPSVPLVASPMKPVRDEVRWGNALELVRSLEPEVLFMSVGPPLCSPFLVEDKLEASIAYLDYLHGAVAAEMNEGATVEEAVRGIEIPAYGTFVPALREDYGANVFNIRGLYHRYSGWFDMNGTSLDPAPAAETASSFVADMGGRDEVLEEAGALDAEGREQLALEYLDLLIDMDPADAQAVSLKKEILEEMSRKPGLNPLMKNMYQSLSK